MSARNIGIPGITPPETKECNDIKCPFHSKTNPPKIRGKIMNGIVISKKLRGTVIIRQDYVHFIKKYQRYERRNSRLAAHLPECLWYEVNVGDMVTIGACRKISKTKAFIVLGKVDKPEVA